MRFIKELPLGFQSTALVILWIIWLVLADYTQKKQGDGIFIEHFRVYSLLLFCIPLPIVLLGVRLWQKLWQSRPSSPIVVRFFCFLAMALTGIGVLVLIVGLRLALNTDWVRVRE